MEGSSSINATYRITAELVGYAVGYGQPATASSNFQWFSQSIERCQVLAGESPLGPYPFVSTDTRRRGPKHAVAAASNLGGLASGHATRPPGADLCLPRVAGAPLLWAGEEGERSIETRDWTVDACTPSCLKACLYAQLKS